MSWWGHCTVKLYLILGVCANSVSIYTDFELLSTCTYDLHVHVHIAGMMPNTFLVSSSLIPDKISQVYRFSKIYNLI